ncbi:MAG: hypothetical protein KDC57_07980 [Saprospiraceae bacterium]|nr:hypothetical protein [Saprospiraceae bacterium]
MTTSDKNTSIFYRRFPPVIQALAVSGIAFLVMVITKLFSDSSDAWENIWIVVIAFLLFFGITNSIFTLSSENQSQYFNRSLISYAGLSVLLLLLAYLFSHVSFFKAGVFKWMFLVVSMSYIILLGIVQAIYRIMRYAQKQDKNLRNEE